MSRPVIASGMKNLALGYRSLSLKEDFVGGIFLSYNYWLSGFRTREERSGSSRLGFALETVSGLRFRLASKEMPGADRVGKYGVDLRTLERVFRQEYAAALSSGKVLLVDELGPMALLSEEVRTMAASVLSGPVPCLVFFRSGARDFERTLRGLDNTLTAVLDGGVPEARALADAWMEKRLAELKEKQ